jgi:hypothetical protein
MALPLVSGWCHLGAAPEVSRGEGGAFRAVFSAAFNHRYKASGNRDVQETCWLRCVAWQRVALQIQEARLAKGAWVYVSGRLKERRRPVGELVGMGDLEDHGRKEISQHELTVYELHLPLPRLAGDAGARGRGDAETGPGAPG